MSKIATKHKDFKEWLNHELKNTIDALELSHETDLSLMRRQLKTFENQLKNGPFGHYIICRVQSTTSISTKNGEELVRVDSVVLEPANEGYRECPHPFGTANNWIITSRVKKEVVDNLQLQGNLKEGALYRAEYNAQTLTPYLQSLISVDLLTYDPIEQSVIEKLLFDNGQLLYDAYKKGRNDELSIEDMVMYQVLGLAENVYTELQGQRESLEERANSLKEMEAALKVQKESLTENQLGWRTIIERIRQYEAVEKREENEDNRIVHEWKHDTLAKQLQSLIYHCSDDNLIYEEEMIATLFRCLQMDVLTILSGPSGTGKSSIIEALGDVLQNTVVKMIPVQSSWTDTQDLLGYFNPIEKNFTASPFLEALADARTDEQAGNKRLHLICLDEMNLAHVEYYFSEFLSAREKNNPTIQLYSKRYFMNAKRIIEQADDAKLLTEEYANALDLLNRYPYEFQIPKNVRFIGTLNMDYTVKPLSPKVIDRSFRIELQQLSVSVKQKLKKELDKEVITGCVALAADTFALPLQGTEMVEAEVKKIMTLSEALMGIPNAPLNSRGEKQVTEYLRRTPEKGRTLTKASIKSYMDQMIMTKLLPRIEVSKQDKEAIELLEEFNKSIQNYKHSAGKLKQMMLEDRMIRF